MFRELKALLLTEEDWNSFGGFWAAGISLALAAGISLAWAFGLDGFRIRRSVLRAPLFLSQISNNLRFYEEFIYSAARCFAA